MAGKDVAGASSSGHLAEQDAPVTLQHSGFSVHNKVRIAADDPQGLENLIQYIARCSFSLSRMIKVTEAGQIIYKTEYDHCHRFPEPASETLKKGVSRNFQVFEPLDFIEKKDQADLIEKILFTKFRIIIMCQLDHVCTHP